MWRILKYLQHLFYLRHRRGYGIHSPSLFELVNGVIYDASGLSVPGEVSKVHRELLRDRTLINAATPGAVTLRAATLRAAAPGKAGPETSDPGAGSHVDHAELRSVRSFVRHSSVSPRYGALLYRIARWFQPEIVLELGTGLGVSTLYLAAGSNGVPLHTIEGNSARADFSSDLIKRCGFFSVKVHVGELGDMLESIPGAAGKRLLAFVDGNHRYGPTLAYIRKLIEMAGEEAVIIMDDIYWSRGMYRAWRKILGWSEVRVSIDLFHSGILLLRKDLAKTQLKMKF